MLCCANEQKIGNLGKTRGLHIRELFQGKYLVYGLSIVVARGAELGVLFFSAYYLTKSDYGELEYYKKIIEVGSVFLGFGLPAFLMTYTRSNKSKLYFYYISLLFIITLSFIVAPLFYAFKLLFLLIPMIFYSIYFTGGLTQIYLLVTKGSNFASIYKIIISVLFYSSVLIAILWFNARGKAFVWPSYVLIIPMLFWSVFEASKKISLAFFRRYFGLFKKLIGSAFTLVVNNFSNMMFLYTDIFVIRFLSQIPKFEIADYSFALNISNTMLLIPLTLVQSDIENLKKSNEELYTLNKKILILITLFIVIIIPAYYFIVPRFFKGYERTFMLFLILLSAKFFQSLSTLFGTFLSTKRKYSLNMKINIVILIIHILISIIAYRYGGILGLAAASAFSLGLRLFVLKIKSKNIVLLEGSK